MTSLQLLRQHCRRYITMLAFAAFSAQALAVGPVNQPTLRWPVLAKTSTTANKNVIQVNYPAELKELDGKLVSVTGYMVPLQAKTEQTRFLLTSKLQDCEFCMEGGPTTYIDVLSAPLRYSSQPFTVSGRLQLLQQDSSGMFFRLNDAKSSKP